jgi:hypothetical protein
MISSCCGCVSRSLGKKITPPEGSASCDTEMPRRNHSAHLSEGDPGFVMAGHRGASCSTPRISSRSSNGTWLLKKLLGVFSKK